MRGQGQGCGQGDEGTGMRGQGMRSQDSVPKHILPPPHPCHSWEFGVCCSCPEVAPAPPDPTALRGHPWSCGIFIPNPAFPQGSFLLPDPSKEK